MSIKDIYATIQKDNAQKVKDAPMFSMSANDFIEEHKELIKTLRQGYREELLAEAQEQEDELCEFMKKNGIQDEGESEDVNNESD